MASLNEETVECVEILPREVCQIGKVGDVFVIAAGHVAPVIGPGNDGVVVDDAELVVHGWRIPAARRQNDHVRYRR